MAGKVLDSFTHGWPGTVSRSTDAVITAQANRHTGDLGFGVPVVMDSGKTGVVPFGSDSAAADLVGFTVRSASKTPDTYGSNEGRIHPGEIAEVLVRGSMTVEVSAGTPQPGGKVYVVKATGAVSASANAENNVELTNVRFRSVRDAARRAEIVILERNLQ